MRAYIFTILILICSVSGYCQTTLQYNLKKDGIFTIKQQAQQVITQELDGATHELVNTIDGVLQFKVLGKVNDNYKIAFEFKDLNLKITSSIQGELMNVNAKEVVENDPQSKIFNSLLNSPVQIVLSKVGDILEVKGGDSLVVKMIRSSGLEDEFSKNMMKKSLENEFGSKALSDSYKQMTFIYPEKKISVGDTWTNDYTGKLSAKNTWKLNVLTESIAKITGTSEVVMNVAEPEATMRLSGTQTTEITTDLATGFIRKMKVEGLSKGISTMTQMTDQEIPTTIKSIITYELINRNNVQ